MNKWLFAVLIVVNLIVFGLENQRRYRPTADQSELQLPAGVQRLQLLSEQESAAASADRGIGAVGEASPEKKEAAKVLSDSGTSTASQQPPARATPLTALDELPQEEPEIEPDSTTRVKQAAESALEEEKPPIGSPEPASEPTVAQVTDKAQPRGQLLEEQPPNRCYSLGPFQKLTDVEDVGPLLDLGSNGADPRQEISEKQRGYWVLIPAPGSRDKAQQLVKALTEAGVKDVWRFTEGKLENAISLGLYDRQGPAQRRSQSVNEKGFASEVQPRYLDETRYWLDYRSADDQPLSAALKEVITSDYPGVTLSPRPCPSVEPP